MTEQSSIEAKIDEKNSKSPIEEIKDEIKKSKESEKRIFRLYNTPNIQSDDIKKELVYISLYPLARTSKPADEEYGSIVNGLTKQPTLLSVPQLKEQVAKMGKTFCGCIFLDLAYYQANYGKCGSKERLLENAYTWDYIYNQALGIPKWAIQNSVYTGGNVANTKDYFILMSTFGLDVDHKTNDKKEDITPPYGKMYEEVRQRIIELDLNTLFAYNTFSDPQKGERFRLIFKTDVPIFSWDLASAIILGLEQIFPEYFDPMCKNVNRNFHRRK